MVRELFQVNKRLYCKVIREKTYAGKKRFEEKMKKQVLIIVALVAFTLTACASAMMEEAASVPGVEMSESFDRGFDEVLVEREAVQSDQTFSTAENSTTENAVQHMVIMNADLSIIVEDPLSKLESIVTMAEGVGGYVVESNVWQNTLNSGLKVPHVNITIRVPADRLDESLDIIKEGVSEIASENVSGQDVTSDYTNLESRLRNLEAAETQLQKIMDEAYDTEDVLQVYNNLVNVREQIEVIKGQMQYYEESARLSRITINITADEEAQPIQIGGWQPAGVAKEAIETLINTLQVLGDIAIWFVLCVLPIGILVGIPLFFVVRYVIRLRRRKKEEKESIPQGLNEEEVFNK